MKLFNALYATPMIALPLDTAQPNVKRPEHTPKKTIIPCTEAQVQQHKRKTTTAAAAQHPQQRLQYVQ